MVSLYPPFDRYGGGGERFTAGAAAALGEHLPVRLFCVLSAPHEYPRDTMPAGLAWQERELRGHMVGSIGARPAASSEHSARVVGTRDLAVAFNDPSCRLLVVSQPYANDVALHLLASLVNDVPVLFCGHGDDRRKACYDAVVSWLPARVVCLDQSETAAAETRRAFYRPSVRVVPGGFDDSTELAAVDAGVLESRAAHRRIVYLGRLLPHKGVDHLLRAARRLPASWSVDLCYREVDPAYENHLRSLAGKVAAEVSFRRDLPDVAVQRILKGATLAVCPSTHLTHSGYLPGQVELLGLVILEMVAAGVPVLASDVPAYAETMERLALAEWVFADGDDQALAALVEDVTGEMSARPAAVAKRLQHAQGQLSCFGLRQWALGALAAAGVDCVAKDDPAHEARGNGARRGSAPAVAEATR